jgi:cell division protein FtsN
MLRWVIALLLVANAGYFLWTQGHLAPLGLAPAVEREPERLQGQIRPEVQRLLNAPRDGQPVPLPVPEPVQSPAIVPDTPTDEAPATAVPAPEPTASSPTFEATPLPVSAPLNAAQPNTIAPATESARACWQAGAFTEAQAERLRVVLPELGLAASGWQLVESRGRGRWIVYMGRYDNAEQLERKKTELRGLKVEFRTLSAPGLAPGLALGTFSSEDAAKQALQKAVRDGVRTARVAQERAESVSFTLRLPTATPAQRTAVASLGAPMAGKTLQACE